MAGAHYISRHTGEEITEFEHVQESIIDILTTPKMLRVRNLEYGSDIYLRIDEPVNREFIANVRMDVAEALRRWEPRVVVKRVDLDLTELPDGVIYVTLECVYKPTGGRVTFDKVELKYRSIAA